jgi:hypothetical protein
MKKLVPPPEVEAQAVEWRRRVRADPRVAGTQEFLTFAKMYLDLLRHDL